MKFSTLFAAIVLLSIKYYSSNFGTSGNVKEFAREYYIALSIELRVSAGIIIFLDYLSRDFVVTGNPINLF